MLSRGEFEDLGKIEGIMGKVPEDTGRNGIPVPIPSAGNTLISGRVPLETDSDFPVELLGSVHGTNSCWLRKQRQPDRQSAA